MPNGQGLLASLLNCTLFVDSLVQLFGGTSKIYEDNAIGKLSDERYATLSLSYEEEQKTLKASVPEMQTYLETVRMFSHLYSIYVKNMLNFANFGAKKGLNSLL